MRNTNKKGFTIVELVIVVAVIAILAAVLIPTFSGIIRKANISSDTVVAKNLNTAAISAGAKDFDSAIAAVKEAGYVLANLNAKASGCYFVWDDANDQFLLVDTTDGYKVIYSNTDPSEKSPTNWLVAVSDIDEVAAIEAAGCGVKKLITSAEDLKGALAAGGEFHLDESVVLDKNNLLNFTTAGAEVIINMGNSQLTSNGSIEDLIPINIQKGTVTINGGIIGATGTGIDLDGNVYATPIDGGKDAIVTINNTQFNGTDSPIKFQGKATLNNVKLTNSYFYSYGNGNVTLNNCVVEEEDNICIWVTNTIKHEDGTTTYDGASTLTVKSGTYKSALTDAGWGTVSVYGGTINIEGGEFSSADGHMFGVLYTGKIVITGGTFNGVDFEDVTDWGALCAGTTHKATVSDDGSTVTITNTTYTK